MIRGDWDRPHVGIPSNGAWFATSNADVVGGERLTGAAREFRALALQFPQFCVPTREQILEFHRAEAGRSGERPFGDVTQKKAYRQLKERGFYGVRSVSLLVGRARNSDDKKPQAYARSFSNKPYEHLQALAALTPDEIREIDAATKDLWRRWLMTGRIWPSNVVSLDERRLNRAG